MRVIDLGSLQTRIPAFGHSNTTYDVKSPTCCYAGAYPDVTFVALLTKVLFRKDISVFIRQDFMFTDALQPRSSFKRKSSAEATEAATANR